MGRSLQTCTTRRRPMALLHLPELDAETGPENGKRRTGSRLETLLQRETQ